MHIVHHPPGASVTVKEHHNKHIVIPNAVVESCLSYYPSKTV